MRRYTIFMHESEYEVLREKIEESESGLKPQAYLNLVIANFLGTKPPKKKKKWSTWMTERSAKMREEPYQAEKLGRGSRQVDRIAQVLYLADNPLSIEQIATKLGYTTRAVGRVLRQHTQYFDAVNRDNRKPFEPLLWVVKVEVEAH